MGACASRKTKITTFKPPSSTSQASVNDLVVTRVVDNTIRNQAPQRKRLTPTKLKHGPSTNPKDNGQGAKKKVDVNDDDVSRPESPSPSKWTQPGRRPMQPKVPKTPMSDFHRRAPPGAVPRPEKQSAGCRFNYECDCGRCVVKHEELRAMQTTMLWWQRLYGNRRPTEGPPAVRHVELQVDLGKGETLKAIKKRENKKNKKSKSEKAQEAKAQETPDNKAIFPPLPGVQPPTSGGQGPQLPELPDVHRPAIQNAQRPQLTASPNFSSSRQPEVSASAFASPTSRPFQRPKLPPVAMTTGTDTDSRLPPTGRPHSAQKHKPTTEPSGRPPTGNKRSSPRDSPQYMDLPVGANHSDVSRSRRSASKRTNYVTSDTSWPSSTSIEPFTSSPTWIDRRDDEWVLQDLSDFE